MSNEEQPMDEIEQQALLAMAAAVESGGIPICMIPYDGPPPNGEFYLTLLRDMIETVGEATGCLTFGTSGRTSGMFPLVDVDPQTGLDLLLAMRQSGMIESVSWVTLACDSYRRAFQVGERRVEDIRRGDVQRMYESGDTLVEDVLMAFCLAPDGPGFNLCQSYRKTGDGIVWGEVESLDPHQSQGAVNDLMQQLVLA